MLSIIDMAEMTYDGDLLNPVGQSDKYLDTKSKTYILGVYMTDLAYAALFGRHEATLDYLEVVRNLSEEIRINEAVDDEMIENAKNNVEYMDSLYNISNDAFMNILLSVKEMKGPIQWLCYLQELLQKAFSWQ